MRRMQTCIGILALTMALISPTSVLAQLYTGHHTDESDFDIQVPGMLDFDQVRARDMPDTQGLPDDGEMYCVPTMTMNLFAFLANNGYSSLDPGPGDWADETDQEAYYTITENIDALGDLMGTSTGGTSGTNWLTGATAWIDASPYSGRLAAELYYIEWGFDTTIERAAYHATRGVVGLCYGFYDGTYAEIGVTIPGAGLIASSASGTLGERSGGHCVSLYSARSSGGIETDLEVMDPDSVPSGDDEFSQSVMTPRAWTTDDVEFTDKGYFASAMEERTSSGSMRVVDAIKVIRPLWVLVLSPTLCEIVINRLDFFGGGDSSEHLSMPGTVRDLVMRPDQLFAAAVTREHRGDLAQAHLIDVRSGETVEILEGAFLRLAFSRFLELYVSNGPEITRFNVDGVTPVNLGTVGLATAPRAMEWIDEVDELWVLERSGDILALPRSLNGVPRRLGHTGLSAALASDPRVRMAAVAGGGVAILGPGSGVAALFREGDDALRLVARYDSARDARDVSSNDQGNVVVALADGALLELTDAENGTLVQADKSPIEGLFTAGPVEVGRSRTNFDRELHTGPGWFNGGKLHMDARP